MPKCTINGNEIEFKDGQTIVELFAQEKEDIAHYCWHPGLSVAGVCRMCMVEIEGMPRLQIACNTMARDGMVINNKSEKVEEAVKWTLDFHLINHPLDCPICDQAGECGLQQQYMQYGKYNPEMSEKKVKKSKAVDLGPTVVLDSERCILCSRCVRFTTEVSKTNELGIFNRGDRSEIGTVENTSLDNNYSLNTVDICPVGALTSKEFRFQQRVWLLKDHETVCTGCSTGCSIKVSYNKNGVFRAKPVHNEKVNGYWMCDQGRDVSILDQKKRLNKSLKYVAGSVEEIETGFAVKEMTELLNKRKDSDGSGSIGLVLTGQYTNEENDAIIIAFKIKYGCENIYYWGNNKDSFDDFDGLLLRGDRNPNTKGLLSSLEKNNMTKTWSDLQSKLASKEIKSIVVAGPENQKHFPETATHLNMFIQAEDVIWMTTNPVEEFDAVKNTGYQIALKTAFEKNGTFINHQGTERKIKAGPSLVSGAFSLVDVADVISGKEVGFSLNSVYNQNRTFNEHEQSKGSL